MIQVNEKMKECLTQITGPRNTGHTDLQSEVTHIVITSTMRIQEKAFEILANSQKHEINRIYDGVEAETRKCQASFQII